MQASRRQILCFAGAGALAWARNSEGNEPPQVVSPRATDGDDRFEPNWEAKFTLSVGRSNADLIGNDDRVLQAAVDYVRRMGGGTVKVGPGVYTLRAAVVLPSSIRLVGSGRETVITRIPSDSIPLAEDSDWYDQEITLVKPGGFQVGDSVVFQAQNPHHSGQTVIKRTLIARSGTTTPTTSCATTASSAVEKPA